MCRSWSGGSGMRFRLRNNRAPRDHAGARWEALGRMGFSRGAPGFLVFAFNARSGAVPLLPLCVVLIWGCLIQQYLLMYTPIIHERVTVIYVILRI